TSEIYRLPETPRTLPRSDQRRHQGSTRPHDAGRVSRRDGNGRCKSALHHRKKVGAMKNRYVIRKYVNADSVREALDKEPASAVAEIFMDDKPPESKCEAIGYKTLPASAEE